MNSAYLDITSNIRSKIERLNSAYQNEKQKNLALAKKINELNNENVELKEQVNGLFNEIKNLKLSLSLGNSNNKDLAKGKLDNLIREVDQCITLINRM